MDALQRQDVADALQATLQHRRRLADDAARQADRHPGARGQGRRPAGAPGRLRRLAALQLDRAGGAPPHAAELRAVPQRGAPTAAAAAAPGGAAADAAHDALVQPTFKGRPVARRGAGRSTDPDAIIRPTFTRPRPRRRSRRAIPTASSGRRSRSGRAGRPWTADPDGLITPTFAPGRRFAPIGDGRPDRSDAMCRRRREPRIGSIDARAGGEGGRPRARIPGSPPWSARRLTITSCASS